MLTPAAIQQTFKYCRPAPSSNSRDNLHKHVRKKGVVLRVVCAKSKSPRMRAPQPRVARDPRNIHPPVPPYKIQRQVQNKILRHRLEDAGTLKACPERIYDASFRPGKEAPHTRVDAIKRGTSKSRHPPANISRKKKTRLPKTRGINKTLSFLSRAPKARWVQGWIMPQPRVFKGTKKKCALITGWKLRWDF